MSLPLLVQIKPRALREIERAARWWAENRPAAPGAIRKDLEAALQVLADQPRIGVTVETSRSTETRRLFLARVGYFVYYRVRNDQLEVVAFWHSSREKRPAL